MNWLNKIKTFLGTFWCRVFAEQDFILGVEYVLVVFFKYVKALYDNWVSGNIASSTAVSQDSMPFVIYIDRDTVRHAVSTYDSILNGGVIGQQNTSAGWVAQCTAQIDQPRYLQEHIIGNTHTWVNGLDFQYSNKQFLFYADPASFNWPTVKKTDSEGTLHVYYRVFGIRQRQYPTNRAVSGFISPYLSDHAPVVWDIHQNGATYYNVKKLLGQVTDSVICKNDGVVNLVWTQQNYNCMLVGNNVYTSKKAANKTRGQQVKAGDVLFGSLRVYKGSDQPATTDIAGIKIMTDAGQLTASNTTKSAYTSGTLKILPLSGQTSIVQAYKNICTANAADINCPYVQIPETVNPYKFILSTIRRGRCCAAVLIAQNLYKVGAALRCIRNRTAASSIINVYVQAQQDAASSVPVSSSLWATAGMTAVAVDATVTIKKACAEANVLL